MPLFYLRPFNFHADKEALRNPKPKLFEFDRGDILTITLMGLIALGLFIAFVAVPMVNILSAALF
ncbi:MAG TPA: hypothetical protein PK801_06175 [Aggregatilineales bacterium]|mgnify:CR=1 FL=1|nr:hypothetical protein [Chloroflexota bacterium]HOA24998.1 hypothetical protein [Aggregatilineales bacterium]HPV08525.1 hypothetical protein [Aggregatilineales bacterium]HQA67888.1 hypothetical protein [Aggregatilineales bacterium]